MTKPDNNELPECKNEYNSIWNSSKEADCRGSGSSSDFGNCLNYLAGFPCGTVGDGKNCGRATRSQAGVGAVRKWRKVDQKCSAAYDKNGNKMTGTYYRHFRLGGGGGEKPNVISAIQSTVNGIMNTISTGMGASSKCACVELPHCDGKNYVKCLSCSELPSIEDEITARHGETAYDKLADACKIKKENKEKESFTNRILHPALYRENIDANISDDPFIQLYVGGLSLLGLYIFSRYFYPNHF